MIQMLGKRIDLHHARVGQKGHLLQTREFRNPCVRPNIDKDLLRSQRPVADPDQAIGFGRTIP